MRKINKKIKDSKLRQNYLKKERKYFLLQALKSNCLLPFELRLKVIQKINKLKNYSKSRIINRCLITNNARSIYRPFNINRNMFRKFATQTDLVGVKKSSQ